MENENPHSRQKRLKAYMEKLNPGIYDTRIAGFESLESSDEQMTGLEIGLDKLAADEMLSSQEQYGFEAIVHKKFRPAVFVINDSFQQPPDPWTHFGQAEYRKKIESSLSCIGRIELPPGLGIAYGGTGFVVGDGLIMTNRHVAEIFARGLGTSALRFKTGMSAAINFRREVIPTPEVIDLTVSRIEMIHPYWDMALLKVEGLPNKNSLTLSSDDVQSMIGQEVAVIGYPAQDPRNDIELQNEIFGGVYNVKRMQPGKLESRRQILSFGNEVEAITHDASTLGGNSGSAVIDVQSGKVLALHFAGLYLDANFAVPAMELARDQRVVDSGVKFSSSVDTANPWVARWALSDSIAESSSTPASDHQQSTSSEFDDFSDIDPSDAATAAPLNDLPSSGSQPVSITIPLTITVTIGEPVKSVKTAVVNDQTVSSEVDLEWLSGRSSSAEIQHRAYQRASSMHLLGSAYSAISAVTTAAASALVYSNNQAKMEEICRTEFDFENCTFLRRKQSECFVAASTKTILVCFRGTQGIRDWIANLNIAEQAATHGMVHGGFLQGYLDIRDELETVVDSALSNGQQLVITGHSLGGALATVAASEWRDRYDIRSIYTFGQPAVGDRTFRDSMGIMKDRFFRIVNDDDIVTRVPPFYKHVGVRHRLPSNRSLANVGTESAPVLESSPTEHMLSEVAFHQLQQQVDPTQQSAGLEGFLPSFIDHKIANYLDKLLKLSSIA